MLPEPSYEERYCAFLDILGFGELIGDLQRGGIKFQDVRELLHTVNSPPHERTATTKFGFYAADLRHQSISDAMCISATATGPGLMHLLLYLRGLALSILHKGYFTRGAVVKGRIYHDDRMAFGEALINAFTFEQTVARYPRIMITREVALDLEKLSTHEIIGEELAHIVGQVSDGPYYLNILAALEVIESETLETNLREAIIDSFNDTASMIQKRFDESVDFPDHFEKVRWFASYWNDYATRYPNIKRIYGAGLEFPALPPYPTQHL